MINSVFHQDIDPWSVQSIGSLDQQSVVKSRGRRGGFLRSLGAE